MKTTTLKHKGYQTLDRDYKQTEEEKAQDRREMDLAIAADPCRELSEIHAALEDAHFSGVEYSGDVLVDLNIPLPPDSEELKAAEKAYDDCHLKQMIAKRQAKNPGAVIVGVTDWVAFGWTYSLITPPMGEYVGIDEKTERMDARRVSLTLALPGYAERDHIRLIIETRVTESTYKDRPPTYDEDLEWDKTTFAVHVGGRIIARGDISYEAGDKDTVILIMRGDGATQELAELVLKQCTGIDPYTDWPLDLYARFALLGRCHQCNRPLTDHVSKILQIGPTCAKKIGLEHTSALAQKVTALRADQ